MHSEVTSTLLKLALPVLVIAFVLAVSKRRHLSWKSDLGLTRPARSAIALWIAAWISWLIVSELLFAFLGAEPPQPWSADFSRLVVVLRIIAIGLLGPFSEELLMRGIIFSRIRKTRLGSAGAIIICAAVWASMHYRYAPLAILLIFLDGIMLGLARYHSRSVLLPVFMHATGNLFSIYQSLSA